MSSALLQSGIILQRRSCRPDFFQLARDGPYGGGTLIVAVVRCRVRTDRETSYFFVIFSPGSMLLELKQGCRSLQGIHALALAGRDRVHRPTDKRHHLDLSGRFCHPAGAIVHPQAL